MTACAQMAREVRTYNDPDRWMHLTFTGATLDIYVNMCKGHGILFQWFEGQESCKQKTFGDLNADELIAQVSICAGMLEIECIQCEKVITVNRNARFKEMQEKHETLLCPDCLENYEFCKFGHYYAKGSTHICNLVEDEFDPLDRDFHTVFHLTG